MINKDRLTDTFLALARIPSPSGSEKAVAATIAERLEQMGADTSVDEAGNVLGRIDGEGQPLLLTAHMDTVTPADSVTPLIRDGVVYSDGTSVLGADDKSGVAVILEVLAVVENGGQGHRPVEALFTVREETGLNGAKAFDVSRLESRMGIGLDAGGDQGTIVVQAPAQNSLAITVQGKAAHAGVSPEEGVNAVLVAAEAIAEMPLGRIDAETTANIGVIRGGSATNIVPDLVTMLGEARSHSEDKLEAQTDAMVRALQQRADTHGAEVTVEVRRAYDAYRLDESMPIVALIMDRMRASGIEPLLVQTGGGSDANVFNARGVQTVQISTGMADAHTCHEYIALDDLASAARLVLDCVRS